MTERVTSVCKKVSLNNSSSRNAFAVRAPRVEAGPVNGGGGVPLSETPLLGMLHSSPEF